jgi:hypothetical protein
MREHTPSARNVAQHKSRASVVQILREAIAHRFHDPSIDVERLCKHGGRQRFIRDEEEGLKRPRVVRPLRHDRLALVSDCFYTLDPQTGFHGHPRVPHEAFNHDTEQARASVRKLAAMEPAAAWAGHADPLTGDVRGQLETAAATT